MLITSKNGQDIAAIKVQLVTEFEIKSPSKLETSLEGGSLQAEIVEFLSIKVTTSFNYLNNIKCQI